MDLYLKEIVDKFIFKIYDTTINYGDKGERYV
jgi:hypothetical protein